MIRYRYKHLRCSSSHDLAWLVRVLGNNRSVPASVTDCRNWRLIEKMWLDVALALRRWWSRSGVQNCQRGLRTLSNSKAG
jgi:hypothetical protein